MDSTVLGPTKPPNLYNDSYCANNKKSKHAPGDSPVSTLAGLVEVTPLQWSIRICSEVWLSTTPGPCTLTGR